MFFLFSFFVHWKNVHVVRAVGVSAEEGRGREDAAVARVSRGRVRAPSSRSLAARERGARGPGTAQLIGYGFAARDRFPRRERLEPSRLLPLLLISAAAAAASSFYGSAPRITFDAFVFVNPVRWTLTTVASETTPVIAWLWVYALPFVRPLSPEASSLKQFSFCPPPPTYSHLKYHRATMMSRRFYWRQKYMIYLNIFYIFFF